MAIYRGTGGATSVSGDASIEQVLQYSTEAQAAAAAASASQSAAASSASSASTSASNASISESNASAAQTAAETAKTAAETAKTAAETAKTAAETAETNAASSASSAATSETNAAASYDLFDDRFLGAKVSDPSLDNDGDALSAGVLYFNTTSNDMKYYNGSAWVTFSNVISRDTYTATSGQTTFSATYSVGAVDVFLNGVKLLETTDFTATDGSNVVLTRGAAAGDIVQIVGYTSYSVADHYTKTEADNRFLNTAANETVTADYNWADNSEVRFGTDSDLSLYHDGANSYISEAGTGSLVINSDEIIRIAKRSVFEPLIDATPGGSVDLYYNNSKKLETTNTGVTVTGSVTASSLYMNDSEAIYLGTGQDLVIRHDGSNSFIEDVGTGNLVIESQGGYVGLSGNATGFDWMVLGQVDGPVTLYHDGAQRLQTTTYGAFTSGAHKADYYQLTQLSATSSANVTTLDVSTASIFDTTLTEATTIAFSNVPASGTGVKVLLKIIQDAGASAFGVTFPSSVKWSGGTAPTLTTTASAVDMIELVTHDGGVNWYGSVYALDLR